MCYEKKELTIAKPVSKEITIVLREKEILLREVVVTDAKAKPKMIGSPKSRKGVLSFVAKQPFEQVGLMIKNENNQLYTSPKWLSVFVKVDGGSVLGMKTGNKPTGERQLRLRFYSIDDKGGVAEGILTKNTHSYLQTKEGGIK